MEVPCPAAIEEDSSHSRNPERNRKTTENPQAQCENSSDQSAEKDGLCEPARRRSARLLAKDIEREAFILATRDCVDLETPPPSTKRQAKAPAAAAAAVTTGVVADNTQNTVSGSTSKRLCVDFCEDSGGGGDTVRSRKRKRLPTKTNHSGSSGGDKTALKKNQSVSVVSTSKHQSLSSALTESEDNSSPVRKRPGRPKKRSPVKCSSGKAQPGSPTKTASSGGKRNRVNSSVAAANPVPPAKRQKTSTNPQLNSPTKSKRQKRNSEKLTTSSAAAAQSASSGSARRKGKGKSSASEQRDSSEDHSKPRSRRKEASRKAAASSQSESDSGSPLRKSSGSSLRKTFRERKKRSEVSGKDQSPKGKGRKSSSLKGKGKASSSFIRKTSSGFCSLPSLPDFIKITNMDNNSNGDQAVPQGRGDQSGNAEGATGSSGAEGESNLLEPFAGSSEDHRRLQAMLEARGLPPHLLGSLGSKMHYILQKSMSSSMSSTNSSRAQQLLAGVSSVEDEGLQLQSCIELGQLLVMGNEDTLSGFPVKQAVPPLINLLSMEHNFDMMLNACRSLTYMMEALPRSTVVVASAIPILIGRLQVIQCMDVAEQALSALELLSRRHGKEILQVGGLNACLLYLDFFSIATQRSALSVAANCCQSVTEDDFALVADAVPILTNRLQHQDKRSVESCCLCFSRLVDNFASKPNLLEEIASQGLLQNLQQLLVVSPPVISSSTFVTVVRMLSNLSACCPALAVQLLKTNMADTLRYLLVGSGEITLENIELMIRPPTEVYEILSLTGELMPPLPKDGIFAVEEIMVVRPTVHSAVQWEWQDDNNVWRPYGRMENRVIESAHQANEEECSIDVVGNAYIVDLAAMQQFNEETGTTRAVRRSCAEQKQSDGSCDEEKKADDRLVALQDDPSVGTSFVQALFGALYEVFNSMAGHAVRTKCLKTILRLLYHAEADVLADILKEIPVSSQIATMLKAPEYKIVVGAMQMADILMSKLPQVFSVYFHREGVIHQIKNLKDTPLKNLATPTKEMTTPISVPTAAIESPQTPTSTRKRLSDIFRKGRRHLRKLGRARSDEQDPPPRSQTPHISSPANDGKVPLLPPGQPAGTSMPVSTIVGGVSRAAAMFDEAGGSGESASLKGRVQQWIQEQSAEFLDRWVKSNKHNPELNIVKRLAEATNDLDLTLPTCNTALSTVCGILTDPSSNVSAFEIMHCGLHDKLLLFLTDEGSECPFTLNARLRQFLHVFMGLPEQDAFVADWAPPPQLGLAVLLQKLLGCVDQLEQFPVRVHDMPGRRGSQALRFFNTHQIKCVLERHPSVTGGTSQWKGGPLRIDPLATVQTLERYMVVRGFGRQEHGNHFEDLESEESEMEDGNFHGLPGAMGNLTEHRLEFLIGDRVLPYSMTLFQAIKQFAVHHNHEGEEEFMPLGRPEIWIRSHTIYYRAVQSGRISEAGPSGASSPGVLSTSLPATPLYLSDASFGKKHSLRGSSSGGGGGSYRRRVGSGKQPSSVPATPSGGPVTRLMRSQSSREKSLHDPSPPSSSSSSFSSSSSSHPLNTRSSRSFTAGTTSTPSRAGGGVASPPSAIAHKEKEKVTQMRQSPLHQELQQSVALSLPGTEDPSLPILKLLKVLYALNTHWTDLYQGLAGNPVIAVTEFVNNKLTSKTTRQLQDPLNVMTGNFPLWIHQLSTHCAFLFPFECRQTLFFVTTFDRDRALARLQEQQPELSTGDSSNPQQTVTPRFDKKKGCVSRDNLLQQAEKLMNETASNKALLEVHYENEVGTGLGPTLEFYALVSRELQRSELMLWRGDPCPIPGAPQGASSTPQYVHSAMGLFPAPLGPGTKFSRVEEVCTKFHFLGKLMAKSIADSRMLDIPLSEPFYKWMLGLEGTFTAQDLQFVDPVVARSFAQVAAVAVKKHSLENDHLLSPKALAVGIEALTLDGGGSIEDLDLDFTLPGYPDIELKPGGRDLPVTVHNLDEYLKLVVEWTLLRGVARQMEAFREGFNLVFPLAKLQGIFYPSEMDMLICGAHLQKWDIKELMECCRPDHGYSHDSRAVQFLFEVLSTYDTAEQRQFIQFVTGSPRLPVGGFKALSPPLTIVRKTVDSAHSLDSFLPSVMTCVNYLKLPDYSSVEVMREKLHFALREGRNSFHLS